MKSEYYIQKLQLKRIENKKYDNWHWPSFCNTLLAKYYLNLGLNLHSSAHEGICFNYNVIHNILTFCNNHPEIINDLFNFNHCVEEFSLQTIAMMNLVMLLIMDLFI